MAGDEPLSLPATSASFSSSSIRLVTPELWQHSPVDLLFHETPSCSLLSCNQISLLGKHAGSRQEEEYCLCGLSPLSSSCVSPAEVRWEWSTILVLMWPRVTKKELSVTAADKSCHRHGLLSTHDMCGVAMFFELCCKWFPRLHICKSVEFVLTEKHCK